MEQQQGECSNDVPMETSPPSKELATTTAKNKTAAASSSPPLPPPPVVTNNATTTAAVTSPPAHAPHVPQTHHEQQQQQHHSDDSKERQYEHELIPVAVEDCRRAQSTLADAASPLGGPMKLQQGENWLRLERSTGDKVVVANGDTSKHTHGGTAAAGMIIPSIAAYRDLPSEDCYVCIDVDTQYASIKDMRPRRDSEGPPPNPKDTNNASPVMYLARRKRKRDRVGTFLQEDPPAPTGQPQQPGNTAYVGGYDTDDENDHDDYGGVRNSNKRSTKYHPLEPLKRRQLKILHKGDRIVMRTSKQQQQQQQHAAAAAKSNHNKKRNHIHLALEYRGQHQILYSPMNWGKSKQRVSYHHAAAAAAYGGNGGVDPDGGIVHLSYTPPTSFHYPANNNPAANVKLIKPRPSINDSGYQQESGSASLSASTSAAVIAGTELSANKKPPVEEKFNKIPEQSRSLEEDLTDERSYLTGEVLIGEQGYVSAITGDEDPDVAAMRKAKLQKQLLANNGTTNVSTAAARASNKNTATAHQKKEKTQPKEQEPQQIQPSQEPPQHEHERSTKHTTPPISPPAATTDVTTDNNDAGKKTAEKRAEWSDVPSEAAVSPPKVGLDNNNNNNKAPDKELVKKDSSPLQNLHDEQEEGLPRIIHDTGNCSSHSETTEDAGEPTQIFPMPPPVQLSTQQSVDEHDDDDDDSATTLGSNGGEDRSTTDNMDMEAPTQLINPYDEPTQALILPEASVAKKELDRTSSIDVEVASSTKEPSEDHVPEATLLDQNGQYDANTGEEADDDSNDTGSAHSAPLLDETEHAYKSRPGSSAPVLASAKSGTNNRDQDLAGTDDSQSRGEAFDYGSGGAEAGDDNQDFPAHEQPVRNLCDSDVHRVSSGAIMTGPVGNDSQSRGEAFDYGSGGAEAGDGDQDFPANEQPVRNLCDSDVHRVSSGAIMTGPVGTADRMNCASPHMEMLPPHLKQTTQQIKQVSELAKQDSGEPKLAEKAPSSETASVTNVDPATKGLKDGDVRSSSSAEKGAIVPSTKYDGDVSSKSSESSSVTPKGRGASPSLPLRSADGADDPMDTFRNNEKHMSKGSHLTESPKVDIANIPRGEMSEAVKATDQLSSSTPPKDRASLLASSIKSNDVGEESIETSSRCGAKESHEIEIIVNGADGASAKKVSGQTNDTSETNGLDTRNSISLTRESCTDPGAANHPNNGDKKALPKQSENLSTNSKNLAKTDVKLESKSSSKGKKRGRSPIPSSPPPSTRKRGRMASAEKKEDLSSGIRPRVMITGVKTGPRIKQMVDQIGGLLLDSVDEAINAMYVIAGDDNSTLRRTPKLMIGLCRTSNIVHMDWLKKSARTGAILDCNDYLLVNESAAEKKLNFSMKQALANGERLRQRGKYLLDGWSVYVCKGVAGNKAPPEKEMRLIVEAANGVWLPSISASKMKALDASRIMLITSDPAGKKQLSSKDVKNALKLGAHHFTTSWLFHCMISQHLFNLDNK